MFCMCYLKSTLSMENTHVLSKILHQKTAVLPSENYVLVKKKTSILLSQATQQPNKTVIAPQTSFVLNVLFQYTEHGNADVGYQS